MNKLKRNMILFFTLFVFIISGVFTFNINTSYALENGSYSKVYYKVGYVNKPISSTRPSSGSFKTNSSKPSSNLTKPKPNSIKPDSGNFYTKPNPSAITNENTGDKSFKSKPNSIKPDSGSFTTKPSSNSENTNTKSNDKKGYNYEDYEERSSKKTYTQPMYGRGFLGFGRYNPLRSFGYNMGINPIILDIVIIISVLIILYMLIDFIKNMKNR